MESHSSNQEASEKLLKKAIYELINSLIIVVNKNKNFRPNEVNDAINKQAKMLLHSNNLRPLGNKEPKNREEHISNIVKSDNPREVIDAYIII